MKERSFHYYFYLSMTEIRIINNVNGEIFIWISVSEWFILGYLSLALGQNIVELGWTGGGGSCLPHRAQEAERDQAKNLGYNPVPNMAHWDLLPLAHSDPLKFPKPSKIAWPTGYPAFNIWVSGDYFISKLKKKFAMNL